MRYPAQSDMWRLNLAMRGTSNGHTNGLTKKQAVKIDHSRVLDRTRQIFPLTLFPDDLIIEELRVIWFRRKGPWANEVVTIMATDIACVNAASGPFFGHVHVQSLTGGPEIMVDNLLRRNVYRIRSLVEGIALSAREGLKVNTDESVSEERESLMRAGEVN